VAAPINTHNPPQPTATRSASSTTETRPYILTLNGGGQPDRGRRSHNLSPAPAQTAHLFADDLITLIHQTSRGYPRAVNNLAIQALIAAFLDNKTIVDCPPLTPPSPR
jgi:hypothetical protein